jgi:hypothetical protein
LIQNSSATETSFNDIDGLLADEVFINLCETAMAVGRYSITFDRRNKKSDKKALEGSPSRSESAIFEAIDRFGRPDKDRESQLLAIRLGEIALMMPHTNRDKEVAALMALPQPPSQSANFSRQ